MGFSFAGVIVIGVICACLRLDKVCCKCFKSFKTKRVDHVINNNSHQNISSVGWNRSNSNFPINEEVVTVTNPTALGWTRSRANFSINGEVFTATNPTASLNEQRRDVGIASSPTRFTNSTGTFPTGPSRSTATTVELPSSGVGKPNRTAGTEKTRTPEPPPYSSLDPSSPSKRDTTPPPPCYSDLYHSDGNQESFI